MPVVILILTFGSSLVFACLIYDCYYIMILSLFYCRFLYCNAHLIKLFFLSAQLVHVITINKV